MSRTSRGVTSHARHKKVLAMAKGYRGASSRVFRCAKQAVIRAHQYAYRDRKAKKREFRKLWIIRINAAARQFGWTYHDLISGLRLANIAVNRKMLADLAVSSVETQERSEFAQLLAQARQAAEQAVTQ